MSNKNESAFPCEVNDIQGNEFRKIQERGLTKREYFAGLAMQGILTSDIYTKERAVSLAVEHADALLAELEKSND